MLPYTSVHINFNADGFSSHPSSSTAFPHPSLRSHRILVLTIHTYSSRVHIFHAYTSPVSQLVAHIHTLTLFSLVRFLFISIRIIIPLIIPRPDYCWSCIALFIYFWKPFYTQSKQHYPFE